MESLMNDIFMQKALDIAFQRMGLTSPNPPVGAVIVRDNIIVSEGGTAPYGGNHAEVNAILSAPKESLRGAEIYVSLEPCSHFGCTPPCTDAIISSGINKVYIPILDPNPIVAGRGLKQLTDAGVQVEVLWEWADNASDLIRHFKKYILRHTPYVIHKSALTIDGKTSSLSGDSKWISSPSSRFVVHKLRSRIDAVIVGKTTFDLDSPRLNVRFKDFTPASDNTSCEFLSGRKNFFVDSLISSDISEYKDPLKIIIGVPEFSEIYNKSFFSSDNFLIYEMKKRFDEKQAFLRDKPAVRERVIPLDAENPVDMVKAVLDDLSSKKISSVLLEGGSELAGSFFDAGGIDQFMYFMAPILLGNGRPLLASRESPSISEAFKLNDLGVYRLEKDTLFCGYKEVYNYEMM